MDFGDLRSANLKRCNESYHPLEEWSPTDWACATAGELGELCNLIKKMRRGVAILPRDVADEIADTLIYLDLLAARLGVDMEVAVRAKFNQVSDKIGSKVKL